LTLTLDPVIRHTVVHYSSTSTYVPNFIEIEETFCGRTDGRTDVRTDIFSPSNIIRSTFGSHLIIRWSRYLFQRLSVVIQRFNAIVLHNSFEAADHLG